MRWFYDFSIVIREAEAAFCLSDVYFGSGSAYDSFVNEDFSKQTIFLKICKYSANPSVQQ